MGGVIAVGVLVLCGMSFLNSEMAWAYLAAVALFEVWLMRRLAREGKAPAAVGEAPYQFTADEAALVGRYRFYFTYPAVARETSSILSAFGLTALVLAPWLTYKHAFIQAILVGANLIAISRLTRELAPVLALRIRANRGDREALHQLELHDLAWKKIRDAVLQPAADPR